MRVALGVAALKRVLAFSEFAVEGCPVDFHSWPPPFALAMIARA
jgi:hypothetical protein